MRARLRIKATFRGFIVQYRFLLLWWDLTPALCLLSAAKSVVRGLSGEKVNEETMKVSADFLFAHRSIRPISRKGILGSALRCSEQQPRWLSAGGVAFFGASIRSLALRRSCRSLSYNRN